MSKQQLVERYFQMLARFETEPAAFEDVFHPEFVQHELPNALNPRGQVSDRNDIFRRMRMAPGMLARQSYETTGFVETADRAVVETTWRGQMKIAAGPLKAGQELTAHFCIVLEFKEGLIHKQRNYDCFEPFA